jgi:hypothetical protein
MVQVASLRISIFSSAEARDKFLYNVYMAMINIINSNKGNSLVIYCNIQIDKDEQSLWDVPENYLKRKLFSFNSTSYLVILIAY